MEREDRSLRSCWRAREALEYLEIVIVLTPTSIYVRILVYVMGQVRWPNSNHNTDMASDKETCRKEDVLVR